MKIEIRSKNEAVIEGYVNAVGRDSRAIPSPKGRFVEQVAPKTFERAIQSADEIELRFNHQKVIGSTKENLKLHEDNIGLYARALVSDEETIEKAINGELRGWSFAFVAKEQKWESTEAGIPRRHLTDIELREVSILTKIPAYVGTSIEMRGEDEVILEERAEATEIEVKDTREPEKPNFSIHKKQIEILRMKGK